MRVLVYGIETERIGERERDDDDAWVVMRFRDVRTVALIWASVMHGSVGFCVLDTQALIRG